jgi:hypothetical protein
MPDITSNNLDSTGGEAPVPVSNFGLKFSYWWVTHKFMLRRIAGGILIAISLGFYAYSGWQAFQLFFVQQQDYRQLLANISHDYIDYGTFRSRNAAKPIEISDYAVLGGRDGIYDMLVRLYNPNPQYTVARTVVKFSSNGEPVGEREAFILPGDSTYVGLFGVQLGSAPNPEVEATDVAWKRVHQYEEFSNARLAFAIDEVKFHSPSELGLNQTAPVSSVTFRVRNAGAFNFWRVGFSIVLRSGSSIIGANYITAEQFLAGEERTMEVRWSEPLGAVTDVEVVPEVNILDESVYLPPR